MLNTKLRTASKNEFENIFFKLVSNRIFRVKKRNIRMYKDIKLANNDKNYHKYLMKPNFKDAAKLSKSLIVVEMEKTRLR